MLDFTRPLQTENTYNQKWDKIEMNNGFSQFSCSVINNSLQPHGLQHARPLCPSPTSRACANSCPLTQWCHPTIASSVISFSSCLQSFPLLGSFLMSGPFASGGQSSIQLFSNLRSSGHRLYMPGLWFHQQAGLGGNKRCSASPFYVHFPPSRGVSKAHLGDYQRDSWELH